MGELLNPGIKPFFLLNLAQQDMESIATDLAPSDWLQEQTEGIIDQAFAYLNYGGKPALTVSLVALKERLAGEEGIRAFMRMALAQPPCTPEQIEVIESDADIEPEDMPICHPPEALKEKYTKKAKQTLQSITADILNEADLIALAEKEGISLHLPEEPEPLGDDLRAEFQLAKWGTRLSPLVPVVMLLVTTLAAVRSWKDWARWWSIPFLVVGATGLVLALAALPANWAFGVYVVGQAPPELTPSLVNVGLDIEKCIVRSLVTWIAIESGILTVIGLALLGIASLFKGGRNNV